MVMGVCLDQRRWRGGEELEASCWPAHRGRTPHWRGGRAPRWRGQPPERSADSGPRRLGVVPGRWVPWALLSRGPRVRPAWWRAAWTGLPHRPAETWAPHEVCPGTAAGPQPRRLFTTRGRQRATQQGPGAGDPEKLRFSDKETGSEGPRDPLKLHSKLGGAWTWPLGHGGTQAGRGSRSLGCLSPLPT